VARNRIHIRAEPEAVFGLLSDPDRYPEWVVGASDIRDYDRSFPEPGSRFHHEVGLRAVTLSDHTEVLEADSPRRLVLKAKARPLGTARIALELSASAEGTEVLMDERPGDRLSSLLAGNPVADGLLRLRNAESLSRLKRIAEGRPAVEPVRCRRIAGQRVLLTGASSGIGLATAELLAEEGARVALLARGERGLERAGARLEELGAEPVLLAADVRDREALDAAVEEASAALGGLDVVVAAAAAASFGPFTETPGEDFDATVATVLGGTANTIRATVPQLERSAGAIVVIGSIAARMPLPGLSAYTAAKHALAGLLWTLRVELAEAGSPLTVSLVNPGAVDTPLWDHLDSATGLLPPAPPDLYSAEAVAEAVVARIRRPREEQVVGGSARAQIAIASHLGGLGERGLKLLTRFNHAAGDRPASGGEGALHAAQGKGEVDGGFGGRGSVAVGALAALDRVRRGLGAG
jgi:NAD(P)-dependent dehydrogenase (short-subunit alcohol dehydrogenase family)/uncharacterized protein YndB with AHSA1/START domain